MDKQEAVGESEQGFALAAENFRLNMIKYRKAIGISPGELAKRMSSQGFSSFYRQTIQRIEDGERAIRLDEAFGVAEILGKTLLEMTDSRLETDLLDALSVAEVETAGAVRVAAGQRLSSQAILAETADLLAENDHMPDDLTVRVRESLSQCVVTEARELAERAAEGLGHPVRGKFGDYWLRHQLESISPLPGYRLTAFEHDGRAKVGIVKVDLANDHEDLEQFRSRPITERQLVGIVEELAELANQILEDETGRRKHHKLFRRFRGEAE